MGRGTHAPENVGFSHNVEANVSRRTGKVVVEEIVKVQSVDLKPTRPPLAGCLR